MGQKTPFYARHVEHDAKIVDFGGWDMPLHYGSQLDEHHATRQHAGLFDVSHMTVVDVEGTEATAFLRHLLANDIAKLKQVGQAQYGAMLNEQGGVVDDLITYYLGENHYRIVVNAATREKDLNWINQQATAFSVGINHRDDLAMLALQGPKAIELAKTLFSGQEQAQLSAIKPFSAMTLGDYFVARTGYTGEDGFELLFSRDKAETTFDKLVSAGVRLCGLGTRDTLRLEAGLNLYGAEMDETCSPLSANMAWTVSFDDPDRQFVGRAALEAEKESGIKEKLVGLVLEAKGVLRGHQKVIVEGIGEGVTTSGTFSPTLKRGIALAKVPVETGSQAQVEIRNKTFAVQVVRPCFVRKGKALI